MNSSWKFIIELFFCEVVDEQWLKMLCCIIELVFWEWLRMGVFKIVKTAPQIEKGWEPLVHTMSPDSKRDYNLISIIFMFLRKIWSSHLLNLFWGKGILFFSPKRLYVTDNYLFDVSFVKLKVCWLHVQKNFVFKGQVQKALF
jgi:hypothetical protein